jgi:Lanthionine synthetase C-like protein
MSINPSQPRKVPKRYFLNEATTLRRLDDPKAYLIQSASRIIRECPPVLPWPAPFRGQIYRGLFVGPTSIAYLFLCLSYKHADLEIEGRLPTEWCKAYLELGQDSVPLVSEKKTCGITNEYLASNALKACIYQNERHALKVLDALQDLESDPTHCEWMNGRAGALYILRLMRKWLPDMAAAINVVITSLIEAILPQQPWIWNGRQYLGTVHGEIGIFAQIILSDSSYAPKLENKLLSLLNLQDGEGNWPVMPGKDNELVQFCHGAPGFVCSLLAIRPHFPALHKQIDAAIALGRKITWEKGLLTKEPNFCHGITGNALALDSQQREHFLCFATPDRIQQGIVDGTFEKDEEPYGTLWGEAGRGWVWMEVWDGEEGKLPLYSDV